MGALSEIHLLTNCPNTLLPVLRKAEENGIKDIERLGTVGVNVLRSVQLQRIIIVVGMFSVFEAAVKDELTLENTVKELNEYLISNGKADLATKYEDRRLAINVLKHGAGRSHDLLLARSEKLDFRVKRDGDWFDGEGDLTDGHALVLVDDKFVIQCAELLDDISMKIRSDRGF